MPGWSFATSPCLTLEGLTLHMIIRGIIVHTMEYCVAYVLVYITIIHNTCKDYPKPQAPSALVTEKWLAGAADLEGLVNSRGSLEVASSFNQDLKSALTTQCHGMTAVTVATHLDFRTSKLEAPMPVFQSTKL